MVIFRSAEAIERQHAADRARCDAIRANIQQREAQLQEGVSFDALVAADEEIQALHRTLVIAEGVATRSSELLERARAEAAERAAAARNTALQREAAARVPRVRAIFDLEAKLVGELAWLRDHVREVADYNRTERGGRPFVRDAEDLVRRKPERDVPTQYAEIETWIDAQGREATQFVERGGVMVPAGIDQYKKVTKRVITANAHFVHSEMPQRLTEAVRLVSLEGGSLWPRDSRR